MANKKFIPRPKESAKVIKKRWSKKRESIETLANNIQRLRYNVSTDLKSDNEKIFLTALVVAIMDKTAERVGNEESASNGHVGITGLKKTQVNVIGNKVILEYTGKSGVEHEKMFSDERIAKALKQAKKNSKTKYVFTTSDGFKIKADRVNRYLSDFDITEKDIRGYSANKWAVKKLNEVTPEETEHKRKRQFNSIIRKIANKVGHGMATLKNHYLIPELEPNFIENGKVIDINDISKFNDGGSIKMKSGGNYKIKPVGGNKGYVGYSMSVRAQSAYEEGKLPYSKLPIWAKKLVDADLVSTDEWHHTSSYGNKTPFYNVSQFDILTDEQKKELGIEWDSFEGFKDVPKTAIKLLNDISKEQIKKKNNIKDIRKTYIEEARKRLDDFNSKFKKFKRVKEAPKYAIIYDREMEGKYGWFEASYKYNLPIYYSGIDYETEENYKLAYELEDNLYKAKNNSIYELELSKIGFDSSQIKTMENYNLIQNEIMPNSFYKTLEKNSEYIKKQLHELSILPRPNQEFNISFNKTTSDFLTLEEKKTREEYHAHISKQGSDFGSSYERKLEHERIDNMFYEKAKPRYEKAKQEFLESKEVKELEEKFNEDKNKANSIYENLKEIFRVEKNNMRFGGGINLKSPNGKPSNLSPEQYRIVRTPEFKAWFGDWEAICRAKFLSGNVKGVYSLIFNDDVELALFEISIQANTHELSKKGVVETVGSEIVDLALKLFPNTKLGDKFIPKISKVVDENGEPLVVYHSFPDENISGEKNNWHKEKFVFDHKKEGAEMLHKRRKNGGIYFSSNKSVSKQYGENTFEFFLNFKNPIILDGQGKNIGLLDEKIYESGGDDVIVKNVIDEIIEPIPSDIFITSNPNSIKLADGSNISFDSNNPDVRMNKGGEAKNPYAICTTSIANTEGTTKRSKWDDDAMERYESCVLQLKDKKSEGGTLTIKNKKVYEGDKKLRDMTYEEAEKYMGFYIEKEGNMFFRKGFFLVWFYDVTDFIQKINSQEWDFLFFPPMTDRMVLSAGYGIVDSIWKRNFQKKNKGAEHLLGMLQGWYDEENKKIYIQYMSVKPSARRNRINTFMVKEAKKHLGTNDVFFAEPTKDGVAFRNSSTYDKGGFFQKEKLPLQYIKVIHPESNDYVGVMKFDPNNPERTEDLSNLIYLSKKAGYRFVPISEEEYKKIVSKTDYEKLKKFQEDVDLIRNKEDIKKLGGETNSDKNREDLFGLDKAKNLSEFDSNIEKIVSQYAHRKMAALQVESYLNENKDFAKQWLKDKSINSRDELAEYTNKLQSKLRAGVRKERTQSKADYHVDRIFSLAHQQEKEWQERIDKSDKDEMSKGGELTDDEKSEIYSEWRELINMSASELEKFMNTEEGKEAGLSKDEADELGIKSGRESAKWIIRMKKTPNKDWTPTMWDWAKRQVAFVKRMKGNKGDLFDDKGNKTRKHTSLLIWGHNPKK